MNPIKSLSQRFQGLKATREQTRAAVTAHLMAMGLPGSVATVIGELVTGVVMLFVGLFMVDIVNTATALNASTSDFVTVHANLITTTGTIFTVLGLVIIVVALATAIGSLRNMF